MAATAITPTEASSAGVVSAGTGVSESAGDNVNGNSITNDGKIYLQFRNPTGGSINLTFTTPGTLDGGQVTLSDPVVAVAAGVTKIIGPLDPSVYGNPIVVTPSAAGGFFIAWHVR